VRDPDDWFGAAADDDGAEDSGRTGRAGEDWLADAAGPPRRPWYETIDRRLVVVAVVAVVLLLAILAAAGVFSSSSSHPSATATTAPPTTTTPTQTQPATTPSSPAVPAPTANLKPGDTGAQVKVLQRALASLGYSPGAVDGDYGPATQAAVEKFQRAAGLKVDGIAGPATRRALANQLSSG
jgi:Putative peptidoglycan binding domain